MSWIILAVFAFTFVGAVLYAVGLYNGLVNLKHAVDRAWANIDVLLKQRHDELPKLVNTVKGYMQHEKEVLTRITEARSAYARASGPEQQAQADAEMRGALGRLFAVAENYPELKADTSFQMLQERISAIEEQIADRREFYNHSVNVFNVRIEQIPDVFMANLMRLEARELFRAAEEERRDVEVSFP